MRYNNTRISHYLHMRPLFYYPERYSESLAQNDVEITLTSTVLYEEMRLIIHFRQFPAHGVL